MRASSFFCLFVVACSTDTFVGGDASTPDDGGGAGDASVEASACVPSFCANAKGATTCNDFDESNQPSQWSTDTSAGTIDTTPSERTSCPNGMRVVFPVLPAPTAGVEPHAYAVASLGNPQDVTATFDAFLPNFPAGDGGDVDGFVVAALRATLDGSWAARVERSGDGGWYLRLRETGGANPDATQLPNMLTGTWNHMTLTVHYAADNSGSASLTYQTTPSGQTTTMSVDNHPTLPAAGSEFATFAAGAGALSATTQTYTFYYDSIVIQAN